jgi:hypothetical protein
MQKTRIVILVTFLAATMAACLATNSPGTALPALAPEPARDMVFATPEEAVVYYFEGVAEADLHKILQSCAIDEMSEGFRFDLYTERLGVLLPVQSLAPADYPLYVETNQIQLSAQISNQVKILTYSLLSAEEVAEAKPIQIDAARANNFKNDINPARLAQLEVVKIGTPEKELMASAKHQENAAKLAHIYGADESTERVALFSLEGNYYYLGFSLLRYGDNWKISSQVSQLAGTNVLGSPETTTVEEFERLIGGD